jgi:phage shock protein A
MSLIRRMRDITAATLNEMLEQAEDPVRLIDNYLSAQREQIQQSEKLYQQAIHHAQSLRLQYLTAEQLKEKREQQAMMALKAGEEEVARLALQEKMLQEEKGKQYKELYEQGKQSIIELEAQLQRWKADYREVQEKRQFYVARLETVRLQQRLNERINAAGLHARVFNRMEDRMTDLELEAQALRNMQTLNQKTSYFAESPIHQDLDQEFENLKRKLQKEGAPHR